MPMGRDGKFYKSHTKCRAADEKYIKQKVAEALVEDLNNIKGMFAAADQDHDGMLSFKATRSNSAHSADSVESALIPHSAETKWA